MRSLKKVILITGCSSGIGHDAAIALSKRGHQVIASCRKEEDCEAFKAFNIDAVRIDVDSTESIRTGFAEVLEKTKGRLDVLINNAGFGQVGALEDLPRAVLSSQFETNVFGLIEMTQQVIPIMRKQKSGRIINVSSVLGFISMPFRGAYAASKYAVEGVCDTLRLELKASGIEVICIEPGPIVSRFRQNSIAATQNIDKEKSVFKLQYQRELRDYEQRKNNTLFTKSTQALIPSFIHAIEAKRPKARYRITFPAHFFSLMKRFLSTKALDGLILFFLKKNK